MTERTDTDRINWLSSCGFELTRDERFGWGVYDSCEGIISEGADIRSVIDTAMDREHIPPAGGAHG